MELKGALCYRGPETHRLGEVLRVRTPSRLGVDVRVGIGPSITVAASASAQVSLPGGVLTVAPDHVTDWLPALPVETLHGVGPRQAGALHEVRKPHGEPGRGLARDGAAAAGVESRPSRRRPGPQPRPRPVGPQALPAAATVRLWFDRHVLDGANVRALLDLVVKLGCLLRRCGQAARAVSLTLRFAGGGAGRRPAA
ncbi:hypothetical protein ACFQ8O_35810 [Streptomyces coelicoflavus]|uniref:hypothetical protein n=1 Tax=Streptomyces coelicoflavus TaxID=285562 RepID=UPI0036A72D19